MKNRIVCSILVLAAAVSAFAVERRWVGPETGGLWRDAANWDPAGMVGENDVPVFDREGTFEIGVAPSDSPYNYLAGLKCEKGTVRLYNTGPEGDYKNFFRLKSAGAGSVRTNDFYARATPTSSCRTRSSPTAPIGRRSARPARARLSGTALVPSATGAESTTSSLPRERSLFG